MTKTICLYFQIHQPFRLKRYRFFDIGNQHHYFDNETNEQIVKRIANNCYLKANQVILDQINSNRGQFKVAFSISGTAIEQFEQYAPEVIKSFQRLAATGCVEFLGESYAHSLASVKSEKEFKHQVNKHKNKIKSLFQQNPKVLSNTELIYSDEIGETAYKLGFHTVLCEGTAEIIKTNGPNHLYKTGNKGQLRLLLRNYKLSDDIAFRFSDESYDAYPINAERFTDSILSLGETEDIVNLFMDYETFGENQKEEGGIFTFLQQLPTTALSKGLNFMTPSEVGKQHKSTVHLQIKTPISWADEERDLSAWLGNELQQEAFRKLYLLSHYIEKINDLGLLKTWEYLQTSDHFYYMSTKASADGEVHTYFTPYSSPYDAFMNYMNVLSDFELELKKAIAPTPIDKDQKIAELEAKLAAAEQQVIELNSNKNSISSKKK